MSRVTDISYCAYHFASTRVVQNRSLITFGGEAFGSRVMKKNPDTWATMVAKGGKWTSNKGNTMLFHPVNCAPHVEVVKGADHTEKEEATMAALVHASEPNQNPRCVVGR